MNPETLKKFHRSVKEELLNNIAPFWMKNTIDNQSGGFYGRVTNDLKIESDADRSLILYTRILWTFASLYNQYQNDEHLNMANRAYDYLKQHFFDKEFGGMFWIVDYKGKLIDDAKKIYGQAFSIYALSEYYRTTGNQQVLDEAIGIYQLVEKYNYDLENTGYFETSNRDWTIAEEMRLSEIDMNEMKSMNTHLHLMEAYTMLYRARPDEILKQKLYELIQDFRDFIIEPDTMHFKLFFDAAWHSKSQAVSYGHDIEGSWLLWEAAEVLNDHHLSDGIKTIVLAMLDSTMKEGFSKYYAIFAERNGEGHGRRGVPDPDRELNSSHGVEGRHHLPQLDEITVRHQLCVGCRGGYE